MKREEKKMIIQELTEKLNRYDHFYLTDISNLDAADTSLLRRKCYDKSINLLVVKNTLLKKALEQSEKKDGLVDMGCAPLALFTLEAWFFPGLSAVGRSPSVGGSPVRRG